jgi:adenylylsulfate kinase-like enzyme
MVIWLIGLSGSGKSTLGAEIYTQLRNIKSNTVLLDGDEIRKIFSFDRGDESYTIQGRRLNADRIVAICEMLDKQEINVVCCILSIFEDIRAANKKRFAQYFEIFMQAPLEILKQRDVKGLYAAAAKGEISNVVGIDIPFEPPTSSDIVIDTSKSNTNIPQLASNILELARLI